MRLIGNGKEFGLAHLNYTYQEGEGGIAEALRLAEEFAEGEKIGVILGDNIMRENRARRPGVRETGAGRAILLKEVPDAERFGVAELAGDRILGIEEKPGQPKRRIAVIGIYLYDGRVFEKVRKLVPSRRNELEITDVNNAYIKEGSMSYAFLDGWWTDAGTFESLLRAANLVAETRAQEPGVVRRRIGYDRSPVKSRAERGKHDRSGSGLVSAHSDAAISMDADEVFP